MLVNVSLFTEVMCNRASEPINGLESDDAKSSARVVLHGTSTLCFPKTEPQVGLYPGRAKPGRAGTYNAKGNLKNMSWRVDRMTYL